MPSKEKRMLKLCVFDLDGTLCDTMPDIADSLNQVLRLHKLPEIPIMRLTTFVSNGGGNIIRCAIGEERYTEELYKTMCAEFYEEYGRRLCDRTRPFPGMVRAVTALHEAGILCGVLTNKEDGYAKRLTGALFPTGIFSFVVGSKNGYPPKPDPTSLNILLSALGIEKSECVFIGDTEVDALTARNAGIRIAGVTWGYSPESLFAAKPDFSADSADELTSILLEVANDQVVCV